MKDTRQQFSVSFSYPVLHTRDVFRADNTALVSTLERDRPEPARCLAFLDQGMLEHQPDLPERMRGYAAAHADRMTWAGPPVIVPGGEEAKHGLRHVRTVMDAMIDARLCRRSYVIAVGGGAVLDAVGLAASLVHRGLRLIRLPTTVLAQNDAGIGVKNGVNDRGGKNMLGTFAPPHAVINDLAFLSTLDDTAWRDGIAEAVKVAVIKDASFLGWLESNAGMLAVRNEQAMEYLVQVCAELHLDHIGTSGDPFETGSARPLDFGHWAAHELERMTRYRVSHGHAVAMGIRIDTSYAARMGWIRDHEHARVQTLLDRVGFPAWYPALEDRDAAGRRQVFNGIKAFREHLGGELTVTFPDGLGSRREEHVLNVDVLEQVLAELHRSASCSTRPGVP